MTLNHKIKNKKIVNKIKIFTYDVIVFYSKLIKTKKLMDTRNLILYEILIQLYNIKTIFFVLNDIQKFAINKS